MNAYQEHMIAKYRTRLVTSQTLAEGINTNPQDTNEIRIETMYNKDMLLKYYSDKEIQVIANLNEAWSFLHKTIDEPLNYDYACQMHKKLAYNLLGFSFNKKKQGGHMRIEPVKIRNSTFKPPVRLASTSKKILIDTLEPSNYASALEYGLSIFPIMAKNQFFVDVNKRTALLTANKALLQYNVGLLLYPETQEQMSVFGTYIVGYYEDRVTLSELINFLYSNYLVTE